MGVWLLAFLVWSSGALNVPAFGPWCDYSQGTVEEWTRPSEWEVVGHTRCLNVETRWTPPGTQCAQGLPLEKAQIENGGPIGRPAFGSDAGVYLLQLIVIAVPIASWWLAGRTAAPVATRRRICGVLVAAGVAAMAWGVYGVIDGSTYYGAVFLGIGAVLAAVGIGYRRMRRTREEGPASVEHAAPLGGE